MIKLVIMDFDGVFTDNKVITSSNGEEFILCSKADSLYLNIFKKRYNNINLLVISSENNSCVKHRLDKLGIEYLIDVKEKREAIKQVLQKKNIKPYETVYIGNDLNDLSAMQYCGYAVAIKNSPKDLLNIACYVTKQEGGNGAIREVLELIDLAMRSKSTRNNELFNNEKVAAFPHASSLGEREWGEEKLLVVSEKNYIMKSLLMNKGSSGDLQKHHLKDEAGYIVYGKLKVVFAQNNALKERILFSGDVYHFPTGCVHKSIALENTLIIECSTPHFNDRIRMEQHFGLEELGGLPSTRLEDVRTSFN